MSHLYIANGTRQIFNFMYRLPEVPQVRQQSIRVGGQIRISAPKEGLNNIQIDAIIEQHRKYGLIPVSEIEKGKTSAPLAYQIGSPIPADRIARLMLRNEGVKAEMGRKFREDAAVVMTAGLGTNLRESGVEGDLNEVEVEVTEVRDQRSNTDNEPVGERTIVTKEGAPRSEKGGRKRRS